jgi:hypothetical protein
MAALRTATVAQLWNITERLNLLHPANWTREVQPLIQAATFLSVWELNPQAMLALQFKKCTMYQFHQTSKWYR